MAGDVISFNPQEINKDISNAYDTAAISAKRGAYGEGVSQAEGLQKQLAGMGGEAFDTGASKQAFTDVYSRTNENIANIVMNYAVNKNNAIRSSDQFLMNLASQGIIDPKTGNYLKSTFAQNLELADLNFRNRLESLKYEKELNAPNLLEQVGNLATRYLSNKDFQENVNRGVGTIGSVIGKVVGL